MDAEGPEPTRGWAAGQPKLQVQTPKNTNSDTKISVPHAQHTIPDTQIQSRTQHTIPKTSLQVQSPKIRFEASKIRVQAENIHIQKRYVGLLVDVFKSSCQEW